MNSASFYKRYKLFLGAYPALRGYLRWVYAATLRDFERLGVTPIFDRALLCGTSGEVTSSLFAAHVLKQSPTARITILDLAAEQVQRSRALIQTRLAEADVRYVVADARRSGLAAGSQDFIDTDFLFVYLDAEGLDAVFAEWRRLLSPRGTVAFRTFATRSPLSAGGSALMNLWCTYGLGAPAYSHSYVDLEAALQRHGFRAHFAGRAFLPFGYRVVATLA